MKMGTNSRDRILKEFSVESVEMKLQNLWRSI
jgi:hypothetical protein